MTPLLFCAPRLVLDICTNITQSGHPCGVCRQFLQEVCYEDLLSLHIAHITLAHLHTCTLAHLHMAQSILLDHVSSAQTLQDLRHTYDTLVTSSLRSDARFTTNWRWRFISKVTWSSFIVSYFQPIISLLLGVGNSCFEVLAMF